jgi:hypothetical protein
MKTLLMLSLIGLVLSTGCKEKEQKKTTALFYFTPYENAPEYLNGQLKSVKELNYWAIEKNGKFEPENLITRKERDSLRWSSDFTAFYNESGVLTRIDYVSYEWKINSWVTENVNNLLTKATYVTLDTPRVYFKLLYDEKGMNIESQRYRSGIDTLLNKYLLTHDEKGNIVEVKSFNSSGKLTNKDNFTWNDSYLVIGNMSYNSSDSLLSSSRAEYNDKGFYTKAEYLNGKGEIIRTIKMDYTEYDEHGNWLSALIYENDKPFIICKRIYEYY